MDAADAVAEAESRAAARREGERKAEAGGSIEDNPYNDDDLEVAWRLGFASMKGRLAQQQGR